jgi:hypothetical protein
MIEPAKGTRVSLGLRVRPEIKKAIDKAATDNGRTQAQEAEFLIERGLAVDQILAAMGTTAAQIAKGNLEAELLRSGAVRIRLTDGELWCLDSNSPLLSRRIFKEPALFSRITKEGK